MRVGILSLGRTLYSTRRLREAAMARGHEARVIDYLRCTMHVSPHEPAVFYRGRRLILDAVIPRIGSTYTFYGTAVVRQFEMLGVVTANHAGSIVLARDKLRSMQVLAREGVDLPVTGFAHSIKDNQGLIDRVGGPPLVVKLVEGTQGVGVVLATSNSAAESVISAFRQLRADILVQEYVEEANGSDTRAFVVGDRVVAAMRRQAPPGEFRSNLHRGGKATACRLTAEEEALAVRAARTVGLDVAGVDMIPSQRGPLILEVNASPGLEGIEGATGVDIAGAIIDFIESRLAHGGE
ncbi:MAG: 30S ribosomal protein S6--L-glutamate ligase [Acidobacteria bacterium]|nr:30S ribosomal protein S6--L-glutamate ligase [Acidobacteriota bacterium]